MHTTPAPAAVPWLLLLPVALLPLALPGCDGSSSGPAKLFRDPGSVFEGASRAASVPRHVDVAVGATHDVLVIACQDKVDPLAVVLPIAATTLFVGMGRLDALFYLPEALGRALGPKCSDVDFSVRDASLDGDAWALEETASSYVFHAHALAEGETTFRATVEVDGEALPVTTTLAGYVPNELTFEPPCTEPAPGESGVGYLLPAGQAVRFSHRIHHNDIELSGYGLQAVEHERLTITDVGHGSATVQVGEELGPMSVTSTIDSDFRLDIVAYGAADYDALDLVRETDETWYVGRTSDVQATATIGGVTPCVRHFPHAVTIDTPDICAFERRPELTTLSNTAGPIRLTALSAGTCRLRAEQPETPLAASLEIPIHRTFEPFAFDLDRTRTLMDFFVISADELVVVGWDGGVSSFTDGFVLHLRNGEWERPQMPHRTSVLRAVHGSPRDGSIYAVGNRGGVVRLEGDEWVRLDTGLEDAMLNDVWVRSRDDVIAVGDDGLVVHYDGARWSVRETAFDARLSAVWRAPSGLLHIGGWAPSLLRDDGNGGWRELIPDDLDVAAFDIVRAIRGTSPDDLWVVDGNVLLHYSGAGWTSQQVEPEDYNAYIDLWEVPDDGTLYVMGRNADTKVLRVAGDSVARLPLAHEEQGTAISGIGREVFALTETRLFRYVHDPSVDF